MDVSGAKGSTTYTLTNAAGPDQLTMTAGSASQTVTLSTIGVTGTEKIDFSQLGVSITVTGDTAKTGTELAADLAGAGGAPVPGQPSTIGFNGMAAQGLGTVAQGGNLTANTAIDSAANGLLTNTTQASGISGLSNIGAGLDGVVTTFAKGMLPDGTYTLAVTNTGSVSTLGGNINMSATVTGSTAIDDPANGLWTTPGGGGLITNSSDLPLDAMSFINGYIGTGGALVNDQNNNSGTLAGTWHLASNAGGAVATAAFTLSDGGTTINLVNNNGVLTDQASGFSLDISGVTGPVNAGASTDLIFSPNIGVYLTGGLGMDSIHLQDVAIGIVVDIPLRAGETFQQVADDINWSTSHGGPQLAATVGPHGLVVTNTGAGTNSNTQIQMTGLINSLIGLGFAAPIPFVTSGHGQNNIYNAIGIVNGTGGAADSFTGTLTNNVTHTTYTLTNTNNVLTDNNALSFSIDLSAVTGGSLHTGSATITSGVRAAGVDTSSPRTLCLTDENGAAQTFTLSAGETFQTLKNAINASGLAIHAAMGSNGLALINSGTDLNGSIAAQGSDNVLRGLGLEASDGSAASTSNSVTVTGSLGTATTGGGGGTTITTGASPSSGLMVFQVGANAGDTLSVTFGNATTSSFAGFDTAIANFAAAASDAGQWGSGRQSSTAALLTASDAAIDTLNGLAGTLGAGQNRLEHTITAVGVAAENLSASMSRIRDLDVAAEMVTFTKTQILQQAGIAILSQANLAPQGILALLR